MNETFQFMLTSLNSLLLFINHKVSFDHEKES